jgi:hypothetical protein
MGINSSHTKQKRLPVIKKIPSMLKCGGYCPKIDCRGGKKCPLYNYKKILQGINDLDKLKKTDIQQQQRKMYHIQKLNILPSSKINNRSVSL